MTMIETDYPDSVTVMAALERFRSFLNSAWPAFEEILRQHDWDDDSYFIDDWLDANWDLLVCRQLLGKARLDKGAKLQPFGIGTMYIGKGGYTHHLQTIEDQKIFITLASGKRGLDMAPPFDKVSVFSSDGAVEVLPWRSLQFELRETVPRLS